MRFGYKTAIKSADSRDPEKHTGINAWTEMEEEFGMEN
jgi:hypothetical protein